MSQWCFQCGEEGRPVKAVALDADGEPACSGHAVKIPGGLNAAVPRASAVPPGVTPTAAPSPVQTSVAEVSMRSQPNFKPRQCVDCGADFIPRGARSQRCESCLRTHQNQAKSTLAKKYYANKKKQRVSKSKPALGGAVRIPAPVEPGNEDTTPVHLTAEKLDKLWNLLSLGEKASAIEHVL